MRDKNKTCSHSFFSTVHRTKQKFYNAVPKITLYISINKTERTK